MADIHKLYESLMGKLTDNDTRNALIAEELAPYRDALEQIGIGPLTVAKKRKQQLL